MKTALIVVDVQNDFVDGSLAVTGAADVATGITDYIDDQGDRYDLIVATSDWHTDVTVDHFAADGEDPDYVDTWPVHCMAGTRGAELHDNLTLPTGTPMFLKGQQGPSYSGFDGHLADDHDLTDLHTYLMANGIRQVDVVGIAYDFCVKSTAVDAAKAGYDTAVLGTLTAAVSDDTRQQATREMDAAGIALL